MWLLQLDGLYSMEIETPLGKGGGIIVLDGEKIRGGGVTLYYYGTFRNYGVELEGNLIVRTHQKLPGFETVLGVEETRLKVAGELLADGRIVGTAEAAHMPGEKFILTLRPLPVDDLT